jgi:hypothetical protein
LRYPQPDTTSNAQIIRRKTHHKTKPEYVAHHTRQVNT